MSDTMATVVKKKTLGQRLLRAPYIVWAVLFSVVPLCVMAYYALTDETGSFTLDNLLRVSNYSDIFMRSIWYSVVATLICLVLAYPIAYRISQCSANKQRMMVMLIMLPMWMSLLLRTYAVMNILSDTGLINSLLTGIGLSPLHMINTPGAVIFGMVYNYLPYMILPLYSVMIKIEKSTLEAAQDLGCNSWHIFCRILLPLSTPGIVSGLTMVFVPSVSTFYISQKLGGGKFDLIGDTIERQFISVYDYNLGAAISLILMVLILICLAVMNEFTDDEDVNGGIVI